MLADRLHKSVAEIQCLSFEELQGWLGYLKIQSDKERQR